MKQTARRSEPYQEWRLGVDPEEADYEESSPPPSQAKNLALERLERPLHVVTVEHLAWTLIAIWTIASRFVIVTARPLDAFEARNALFEYDIAHATNEAAAVGFYPLWSGWIHLVQGAIFAAAGSNDFNARLLFMLSGLLMVAMAFELRHYAGRAGAIGLAVLLALSPSITWFSRARTNVTCSATLALVTIALFMGLKSQPSRGRALALGCSAGLMVSADLSGLATAAILIGALGLSGLDAADRRNSYLHGRVWLERYSGLAIVTLVAALAMVVVSELFTSSAIAGITRATAFVVSPRLHNFRTGAPWAMLPLGFYEFAITIGGAAGLIVVASGRVRTRFALFCLFWTVLSFAFYLNISDRTPGQIVMLILPTAILGGIAIDYLCSSPAWNIARFAIAALVIFAIYLQVLTNFIDYAPDPTEASWARHANLYWGAGATTPETVHLCNLLLERIPESDATVFHEGEWPAALRWYLRRARPVTDREAAAMIVDPIDSGTAADDQSRASRIAYEASWKPDLRSLDTARAFNYLISQRAWSAVVFHSATIRRGARAGGPAPTLILPPAD